MTSRTKDSDSANGANREHSGRVLEQREVRGKSKGIGSPVGRLRNKLKSRPIKRANQRDHSSLRGRR